MTTKFKQILSITALTISSAAFASTNAMTTPKVKKVPVNHVFAPDGFDTNDDTQVVVTGYLPNLCYKSPKATQVTEGMKINIEVTALKEQSPGSMCLQAIVPFMEVVSLGVMDKGNYAIDVNAGTPTRTQGNISVIESTSSAIDDFVYAAVDYVETNVGSRTIKLKGFNPSDCFELDQVKMVSNKKDTYAVLPILKQVRETCPMKLVPFEYEVEVPRGELDKESILLHVRVMNGKSVNAIFDNRF